MKKLFQFIKLIALRGFLSCGKEIIDNATDYMMASMCNGSLIRGIMRQDIPEFPEVVLREAIINAVAHRDCSPFVSELLKPS